MAGQLDKMPVSNRMTRANDADASDVVEGIGRRVERHPWPQDAVLGMDVRMGDGDLFGEAREKEATDQDEEVLDIPDDEAEQGEEFPDGADEAIGQGQEISEGEVEDMAPKLISLDPGLPTEGEVDDHEVDHMPFREW